MTAVALAEVAVALVIGGGVATPWVAGAISRGRHERALLREHNRARRAHYAAVEAAEDNPDFSPEAVEHFVDQVVAIATDLWRGGRGTGLSSRPDGALVRNWAWSRQAWLGMGLEVRRKPSVDLLDVVNRGYEDEDRVVVRVRLHLRCPHPQVNVMSLRYLHLDERWTLGRYDGQWVLLSVEGDPLAGPVLSAPLVPNPSADTERLREESLAELGEAQKVGDDVVLSDLVSPDERPAFALLDLSVVDGRFAPALIAAELAHLIEAWEEAVTQSEAPLERLASVEAREALLRPRSGYRFIVRDAVMKSWAATRLDLDRRPPAIEAAVQVEAVRYVVTANGAYVTGNNTDSHRMALTWVLELTDVKGTPWRLAESTRPAEGVPGWE